MLLKNVASGRLKPERLITHRFSLKDVLKAYDTVTYASKERALKVIISMEG
jgi:alcohol dehydrogenase